MQQEGPEFDRIIGKYTLLLVSSVRELVRIRSVAGEPRASLPFGKGPADALEKALGISQSLGFRTKNLDNYTGYAEYGEGEEYVAVLGHLDTVPEGTSWTVPPFGADLHKGKIYGRGALDDKGPVIAALFGLKAVAESGFPLRKRVRVLFGTDEETGSLDISHYLLSEKPPVAGFTPDAEFPVVFAEKGIIWIRFEKTVPDHQAKLEFSIQSLKGGSAVNMVPDLAEALIETTIPGEIIESCTRFAIITGYKISAERTGNRVILRSMGLSAHGSTPSEGKNAVMQLMAFLSRIPVSDDETLETARFFNDAIGMDTSGISTGLDFSDSVSGHLTVNAGMAEVRNGIFSLTVDIRYPVTYHSDMVIDTVMQKTIGRGINVKVVKQDPPLFFPPDTGLVHELCSVYQDYTGDPTPPVAIGGGTYARRLPNIVAFGPYWPGQKPPIHGPDEFITIEELITDAKIYARAIYQLSK